MEGVRQRAADCCDGLIITGAILPIGHGGETAALFVLQHEGILADDVVAQVGEDAVNIDVILEGGHENHSLLDRLG